MATRAQDPVAIAPASTPTADSQIAESKAGSSKAGSSLISNEKLKLLYSTMLRCRMLEEKIASLKAIARLMGKDESAIGQEAALVGAAIDLRPEDALAPPSHSNFITNFIQGVPLNALFSQLYGRATSTNKGRRAQAQNASAPIVQSTVAAQINIGNGLALANKMRRNDSFVLAFFAADSSRLDSLHEALHFAGAQNLPIIFVCQNNLSAEKAKDISLKAQAYGFPGIPVDGKDVVAMYRVAYESIQRARNGGGPTLIEAKTHRREGTFSMKQANDPIANMEGYLTQRNLFTPAWKQEIAISFGAEMETAIHVAKKSPQIVPIEHRNHIYALDMSSRA